ncbi:hypothetical protein [Pseudonocardia acaciae]|uniref:hypothetical protein n=1 Tax=Pseudonocardia acaciae TaxID=551276 RepID=UPI00049192D6|nr:hypothetical protein [Pseudonocardia acaciae]
MTEPGIPDLAAALRNRARPTVGLWNRLEGRPRTKDFDRALRAEIRDPLWLLTRQWQLGEFRGSDGGSPVTVTYSVDAVAPTRFRPDGGQPEPVPSDRPLEDLAERRALPFDFDTDRISFDLRLAIGRRWMKMLFPNLLLRVIRGQYVTRFPIALPNPDSDADRARVAHPEVWAAMQAMAGRRMDGYLLYRQIKRGGHAADGINVPLGQTNALNALGDRLVKWFDGLIHQPTGVAAWDPGRLEHEFSVATAAPGGERVLTARQYPGGTLDWHAFSVDPAAAPIGGTTPPPAPIHRTVFPAPIRFSGMPLPRWWALEDGRTNFAAVTPDSTDLARLIFLEFALVYSNDWYQVPCDLPVGTLATIAALTVTDVFGQSQLITPVGTGDAKDRQNWSMFTLDTVDAPTALPNPGLFLPPSIPHAAEGTTLEEVTLIRDENANMVWGVELTARTATGDSRRASELAAETVAHRLRRHPPTTPPDPRAPVAYQAINVTPENWIPFIPAHKPDDTRAVRLQRATMLSILGGTDFVRPRTALLREGVDAGDPYYINEEEVPRTGTTLTVSYNRTRWTNGEIAVWLSTRRTTGRGETSSGLTFDTLIDTAPKPRPQP